MTTSPVLQRPWTPALAAETRARLAQHRHGLLAALRDLAAGSLYEAHVESDAAIAALRRVLAETPA